MNNAFQCKALECLERRYIRLIPNLLLCIYSHINFSISFLAAVRRNPITGAAAEAEVEKVMKRWLQLAADRDGGRKRRLLAKENMT